jgi:hypothetical protein
MSRLAFALVFLALVAENEEMYAKLAHTPMGTLDALLFGPSALKVPLFFFVVVVMLVVGRRRSKDAPVLRMRRAIVVSLCTMLACAVFGLATGGVFKQVPWQIYNLVVMSLFALVLIDAVRTPAGILTLGKVIVAAAVWRSMAAILFYWFVVRGIGDWSKIPAYMTTHDDTTLFCTGLVIVIVHALQRLRPSVILRASAVSGILLLATQLNNRRLAWVSLAFGLAAAYLVLPSGAVRRRVNRVGFMVAPMLALYAIAGWGRTERIFKPLSALGSLDAKTDSSTASREVENSNLAITASHGFFIGSGFGHPFDAVDTTYELDGIFAQWKFIPHNSYLGLLAFTGILGFAGIWWPLPVSVFLSARGARFASTPIERTAAAVAVAEIVIFANQAYADMGLSSQTGLVLLASAYATSASVAVTTGAWPTLVRTPKDDTVVEARRA